MASVFFSFLCQGFNAGESGAVGALGHVFRCFLLPGTQPHLQNKQATAEQEVEQLLVITVVTAGEGGGVIAAAML